jgi:hypothetical protein
MLPGKYDLKLYRGDSYSWSFVLWHDVDKTDPVDLTGATVAAQLRNKSGGETVIDLVCTVVSTPSPPRTNTVRVDLDAALWDNAPGLAAGVWDLEITYPDGFVQTVVGGKVTATGDVTNSTAPVAALTAPGAVAAPARWLRVPA